MDVMPSGGTLSAIRRHAGLGVLWLCLASLGFAARAEDVKRAIDPKQPAQPQLFNPRRGVAASLVGDIPSARNVAPLWKRSREEVVLHDFSSAPRGAYPSSGVVRDLEGNLYGTTNGSYSDIGGGGTNDAGVVFKIDPSGHETVLYSFSGAADGSSPNGLIRDKAGNIFGTTAYGGASGAGVIYEIDTSGKYRVLYSFTGGNDGAYPTTLVRTWKGILYGTTSGGGAAGYGVVFKFDESGNETALYSFLGGADGAYPNPNVAYDSLGNVYGTTNNGGNQAGSQGLGVVFKVDAAGHETVLHTFTGGGDGAYPNGVIRDLKGYLYGTASNGGTSGNGVVYEIGTSGKQTVLYNFTGGDDGGSPSAALTRDQAGNLFSTTNGGGAAGLGVVFKLDKSGHEWVLHSFSRGPEGNQPYLAGVILDPDSNLYGTTSFSGAGGDGAVYKIDSLGDASVVYAFPGNAGGQYLYNAGVILSGGHLLGTTDYGGSHGAGVVYDLKSTGEGEETVRYTFDFFTARGFGQPTGTVIRDFEGNIYGTTFIGQADTGYGYGVVYKLDPAGHAVVLHNFTGGSDGGNPYAGVVRDPEGSLYGTASGGGDTNNGVVFKIDKFGHETVLYSFAGDVDGAFPYSSLIRDSAGNLYGTTNGGGASGAGVVFKIDPTGHETVLYTFTGGDDGGYPLGGLVRDSAGNFYGTTGGGGAPGAGVVFKIDSAGRETVLYSFAGADDGAYPGWGALARDSAGNLYGTTEEGGADNAGVVFKVDTSGHESVLYSFTGGDDGGNPFAGVVLGPEGQIFGTTPFGGRADVGVVFEIKP